MTTLYCEGGWLARLEHDHLDKHIAQIVTSIHLPPFCMKQLLVPLHSAFCQQNLLLWHWPSLRGVYRLCLCLVGSSCICILWFRHSFPLWLQEVWFPSENWQYWTALLTVVELASPPSAANPAGTHPPITLQHHIHGCGNFKYRCFTAVDISLSAASVWVICTLFKAKSPHILSKQCIDFSLMKILAIHHLASC